MLLPWKVLPLFLLLFCFPFVHPSKTLLPPFRRTFVEHRFQMHDEKTFAEELYKFEVTRAFLHNRTLAFYLGDLAWQYSVAYSADGDTRDPHLRRFFIHNAFKSDFYLTKAIFYFCQAAGIKKYYLFF